MKYLKIFKYSLLVYLTSFIVCSEDIKRKEKSSENDQSAGHFLRVFCSFIHPLTLNLKKIPVNQLIKKFWPKFIFICGIM